MTAESAALQAGARWIAACWITLRAALIIVTLAAFGGWLHTVRVLNQLAAHQVVGAEALRQAQAAGAEKEPVPEIYAGKRE